MRKDKSNVIALLLIIYHMCCDLLHIREDIRANKPQIHLLFWREFWCPCASVKIPHSLKAVGLGPVPAPSGNPDATIPKAIVLGRPHRAAPTVACRLHSQWRAAGSWKLGGR